MDEQLITTGATVSAGATAIVYLWRQVQEASARCEKKLSACEEAHGAAEAELRCLSERVGSLEGKLEILSSK